MLNLSPHASAAHPAARFIGMPWTKEFNCWALVQAVQAECFGRTLPDLPLSDPGDKTAALLAAKAGWQIVSGPPQEGDVLTMIGADGPHVGTMVGGRVLHNLQRTREDGSVHGAVKASDLHELGMISLGHITVWRATR